jgi:DNA helicase-2/ATP-dependent DNA helicase PcrA
VGSLGGFLEETSLYATGDDVPDDEEGASLGRVALMTMHAAKGLEFPVVFVSGLEDGLFPLARADDDSDPEEERRLFYVALTRAQERVYLSWAQRRMRYGSREYQVRSPLVGEVPSDVFAQTLELEAGDSDFTDPFSAALVDSWEGGGERRRRGRGGDAIGAEDSGYRVVYEPGYGDTAGAEGGEGCELEPGDLVEHPRFGRGEIKEIRGGISPKVVVSFHELGERVVDLRYGNLSRVSPF